jgi:hypothetical protein
MNDERQEAYRFLLYTAMLWMRSYNDIQAVGAVANWLHNLAGAAIHTPLELNKEFEEMFWREHAKLCKRFPKARLKWFREKFEDYLKNPSL